MIRFIDDLSKNYVSQKKSQYFNFVPSEDKEILHLKLNFSNMELTSFLKCLCNEILKSVAQFLIGKFIVKRMCISKVSGCNKVNFEPRECFFNQRLIHCHFTKMVLNFATS